MKENQGRNDFFDDDYNPVQSMDLEQREMKNRRCEPSDGFTYISTVGMIDRRERIRRKDDPFDF